MGNMNVIQTEYNGILYRSRTEARFAVMFDALGLPFEYEKEGFELKSGRYLPDFWMPTIGCWIEIKGQSPSEAEGAKAWDLAEATGSNVYIFYNGIPSPVDYSSESAILYDKSRILDTTYMFCECYDCGAIGIEFCGRSDRLPCKHPTNRKPCSRSDHGDKGYNSSTPRIDYAIQAAKSARFEFGDTPRF